MKKIILVIIICLSFVKVRAQPFHSYADTANYLIQRVGNNKNFYIGKPLSALMDSLKLTTVDIVGGSGLSKSDFGKSITLYFNLEKAFNNTHFIVIDIGNAPTYDQLLPVFFPSGGGFGSVTSILAVYNTLTISNITVKDYSEDDPVNPNVHF